MNKPLALVASLVASFVLGAVVVLYGFSGQNGTADATVAAGCLGLRLGVQQENCIADVIDQCQEEFDNRQQQKTCMLSRMSDPERVPFRNTKEEAGESQHRAPGAAGNYR